MYVLLEDLERDIEFLETRAISRADMKVLSKLRFIHLRYRGLSVQQASEMMGISHQTGYNWQRQWNDGCYMLIVPGKSSGRPSRLTDDQMAEFADIVEKEGMTTSEARDALARMYGVEFSVKHMRAILLARGLMYSKGGSGYRWMRRPPQND